MEELLQAINNNTNYTQICEKTPHILSSQSFDCMQAFLQQGKKPCQKINSNTIWTSAKMVIGAIFYLLFGLL